MHTHQNQLISRQCNRAGLLGGERQFPHQPDLTRRPQHGQHLSRRRLLQTRHELEVTSREASRKTIHGSIARYAYFQRVVHKWHHEILDNYLPPPPSPQSLRIIDPSALPSETMTSFMEDSPKCITH